MAVMLIGVFCTVDSRFSAVTMISCNSSLGGATCAHTVLVNAVQHPKAASARLTQYCLVISPPLLLIGQLLRLECSTPYFISLLIGNALLRQRIQFILHDPAVNARAITLQIVYVARGTLSATDDVRNRREFIGVQSKPADLRMRLKMRGIDGSDDRRSNLIPIQHHPRRNGSNIGVMRRGDAAKR